MEARCRGKYIFKKTWEALCFRCTPHPLEHALALSLQFFQKFLPLGSGLMGGILSKICAMYHMWYTRLALCSLCVAFSHQHTWSLGCHRTLYAQPLFNDSAAVNKWIWSLGNVEHNTAKQNATLFESFDINLKRWEKAALVIINWS